ncbi:MAG: hypothetical protein A3C30_01265 [Candidatus Levybacteria bacterium RIFCSPHIGHO2_02_FULL_40_18]|nr:MAG: hypothetical protein A2869_00830 [Candidatus Levybacteria bacterium RIFCSPHIGHO2_01_FULL_40_58]OGH26632.1 MAG: hypothetical protein A3C30_01265 [Candidatus Levybacteria bacterium RIFCSPHIGHO2_02_FULL_40_18]OGH31161.1 MAG: hypothetical protein A3E43_00100 [Candidatus Levybacteria bacterium RIFCSPHIGHO2_12_FULL_40_31]OGH39843.1 MAG: hypothetical protein A2894_03605 [Candidatus Levybacteria bacterium RIFCSPLOWO2_01_FULL_40_64]OGH48867.1 MAG: hypothetical protein A3I54_04710 [Candidatus Lev
MTNKSINNPATIADVNKAVKGSEKVLGTEILRVEERVENLEEGQKRLEGKVDKMGSTIEKISNQLDGFVGRVDDLTNDNEIGTDQIHELRETAKDHEKRIAKLESPN